jgi:hypothetical protein
VSQTAGCWFKSSKPHIEKGGTVHPTLAIITFGLTLLGFTLLLTKRYHAAIGCFALAAATAIADAVMRLP